MKNFVLNICILVSVLGCSTKNTPVASNSVNVYHQNQNQAQNLGLEAQIITINAHLTHLDSMIKHAEARRHSVLHQESSLRNLEIDNEIRGYENQKLGLINQRNAIQMQMKY